MTTNNIMNEVTQILNNGATEQNLLDLNVWIVTKLKQIRNTKAVNVRTNLYVGAMVTWTGKTGTHTGEIIKINRTKAQVKELFTVWNVPMGMLKIIE